MSWYKGRADDLWVSFKLILFASRANESEGRKVTGTVCPAGKEVCDTGGR